MLYYYFACFPVLMYICAIVVQCIPIEIKKYDLMYKLHQCMYKCTSAW